MRYTPRYSIAIKSEPKILDSFQGTWLLMIVYHPILCNRPYLSFGKCNAFWSIGVPQGFECIFKLISVMGISILLKSQDRVTRSTRMHCIYQNSDKVYSNFTFFNVY